MVLFHELLSIPHAKFLHYDESFKCTTKYIHWSSRLQAPRLGIYNKIIFPVV